MPPTAFAASAGAAAHVFVDELDDAVFVTGEDGHHLQRVRRLRTGERVDRGRRQRRVADATSSRGPRKARSRSTADGDVHREPVLAPALAVAFALSKGPKPETVVSGLTELGVDLILPFRSRAVGGALGGRPRPDRHRAAASRRARGGDAVPPRAAARDRRAGRRRRRSRCTPAWSSATPPAVPSPRSRAPAEGEWLAVVGPEGGLDAAEREQLTGGDGRHHGGRRTPRAADRDRGRRPRGGARHSPPRAPEPQR